MYDKGLKFASFYLNTERFIHFTTLVSDANIDQTHRRHGMGAGLDWTLMRSISRRKVLAKESEKRGRNSLPGFITGGMVFLFSNLHQ